MKFFLIDCAYLFLIILKIFTHQGDAFETADLTVMCGLMEGTKTVKEIPTGSTGCKSIACEMSTTTDEMLIDVFKARGNLTMVAIEDRYFMDVWIKAMGTSPKSYVEPLKKIGFNAIAFDYMYIEESEYKDPNFNYYLGKFFDDATKAYPEMWFGMVFRNPDCFKISSINIKEFGNHVNFFILKHNKFRTCELRDHQDQMPNVTNSYDILTTINALKDMGLDTTKLIITIPIIINSIKLNFLIDNDTEDMSYNWICKNKMSKDRKFCFDSIGAFRQKGYLRVTENLFGVYIQNIEFDDFDGACGCTGPDGKVIKFKAVNIIAQASQDTYNEKSVEYFYCAKNDFPVITRP